MSGKVDPLSRPATASPGLKLPKRSPLLSVWNLAKKLKTSGAYIQKMMSRDELPQSLFANGKPVWREADIDAWVGLGKPDANEFRKAKEEASQKAMRMFDALPLGNVERNW